jgi:hypothetical protein
LVRTLIVPLNEHLVMLGQSAATITINQASSSDG